MKKQILITGFIGMRPAAFFASVVPYLDTLRSEGDVHLCAAATSGGRGSQASLHKLKQLSPLDKLNWDCSFVFDANRYRQAITDIKEAGLHHDSVYLAIKGGVGSWGTELVLELLAEAGMPELFLLVSDGCDSIVLDRHGRELDRRPLASLGLDEYLFLNGLLLEGGKQPQGSRLCGQIINGTLVSSANPRNVRLNFLCLQERAGFLYAAFDADPWLGDEYIKYQKHFREHMQMCSRLGLEHGRVLLAVSDHPKVAFLEDRAREFGVRLVNTMHRNRRAVQEIQARFEQLVYKLSPGDAFSGQGAVELAPLSAKKKFRDSDFDCKVLCMAMSSVDSFVNLAAIASHRPKHLVIVYDRNTRSTLLAARRLHRRLQQKPASMPYCSAVFLASDHVGIGLDTILAEQKKQYPGSWHFNLTPGTKEQAVSLVLAGCSWDSFWVMDKDGRTVRELGSKKRCFSQQYPDLALIAGHLGGKLLDNGYVMDRVSQEALAGVHRVFAHLAGMENKAGLAAWAKDRPVYDNNGILTIRATGELLDLKRLFPEFSFSGGSGLSHDPNVWFEAFVGASLYNAGADEVVLNMKWKWEDNNIQGFRDELDVAARFGNTIVVVSCKTNLNTGEIKKKNVWEVDYIASRFFGRFAKPFLAVPVFVRSDTEMHYGRDTEEHDDGCRTRILGVNRLAKPETLREFLVTGIGK